MSDSVRFWLMLAGGLVAVVIAYKILLFIGAVVSLIMPLVVVAAIVYVIYLLVDRKSLGGGRRPLP